MPNGVGATALFNTLNLGSDSTVTLATPVTAGALSFGDTTPSHDWLVTGSAITNAVSSGYPTVTVDNRQVMFNNSLFGALKKLGTGTMVLAASSNVFNGGFYPNVGALKVTGDLVLSGGSIYVGSAAGDATGTTGANGTLEIADGARLTISAIGSDHFVIGRNGGVGTVVQNGGTFNFSCGKIYFVSAGGAPTAGTNTLNAGTFNLYGSDLMVGNYSGKGVVNLNGGTALVNRVTNQGNTGTGDSTFNFNGGTLKPTSSRTDFFWNLKSSNVQSGGAKIDCAGYSVTVGQPLLDAGGGLTKSGAGVLTLGGINTYTGVTAVTAGGLMGTVGTSSSNSVVNVSDGATNGVLVSWSGGQWVCGGLTHASGTTTLDFDFSSSAPHASTAPLLVNGNVSIGGTLRMTVRNGSWFNKGTYPLVSYTGTLSGSVPSVPVALPSGVVATLVNNTGSKRIDLSVTDAPGLTWDGTTNNWNTAHWLPGPVAGPTSGSSVVVITNGTVVLQANDLFGNWSTTASPQVNLNGGILKSANNFNTLWNLNMRGGTLLSDGGANSAAQAFQLAGTVTVTNRSGSAAPSYIGAVSGGNNGLNAVNLGGQGDTRLTFDVADVTGDSGADLLVYAPLQNSGPAGALPLIKTGAGTLLLAAANTYGGGTRVNVGQLAVSNSAALGTAAVGIAPAGTVRAVATLTVANPFVLSNGVTEAVSVDAGKSLTLSGAVSGPGGLTLNSAGRLLLGGANTYGGNTVANKGTLLGVTGGSCANGTVLLAATGGNTAAFGVFVSDNTKQWTCPGLTVNNAGVASKLAFDFGSQQPSAGVAPLRVNGTVIFTTTPGVEVTINGYNGAVGAQIPLMTWNSVSGTPPSAVTVVAPHAVTGHLAVIGTTLYLVIDTAAVLGPLHWATPVTGNWDLSAVNWRDNVGTATAYAESNGVGYLVLFDDQYVGASATATLSTAVSPERVVVSNSVCNYTLSGSGSVNGASRFRKVGGASFALGATLNTGNFQVNGGNVTVGSAVNVTGPSALFYVGNGNSGSFEGLPGCSGSMTINSGASIILSGGFLDNVVIGRDSGSGSVVQNGGLLRLVGTGLIIGANSADGLGASYALNGGTLDMAGYGLYVCLSGSNSRTGVLNQAGGTISNVGELQVGAIQNQGTGIYTLSGGSLMLTATNGIKTQSGRYQLNLGGGTVTSTASWRTPLDMNLTNLNGSVTFSQGSGITNTLAGRLSGNGGLIKGGAGVLVLAGTNTYAGATAVSGGTLLLNGVTTNCAMTVASGAALGGTGTLQWQAGQTITASGTLTISQLNLAVGPAGRVPYGTWTVADYQGGTLFGSAFASVTGLRPYMALTYDAGQKKILLSVKQLGTLIRVK